MEGSAKYNRYSNPTYLMKERKNNLFISSTMDYFAFFVPLILVSVFLFYRVFYLLFKFEISKYLRPYSFKLIVFELLIQNNVQYFAFLGFRSLDTSFSTNFPFKLLIALGIIMLFFTLLASTMSYFIYYVQYSKLARYFLVNMFRFPSSYALMIVMYGIRPFMKGAAHAFLYENWEIQIWTLTGI